MVSLLHALNYLLSDSSRIYKSYISLIISAEILECLPYSLHKKLKDAGTVVVFAWMILPYLS